MHPTLELFATEQPTPQATADIFKDLWLSLLPGGLRSGPMDMFHDKRVTLAHNALDFTGKSVLELGPLEGGHTYGIHAHGASSITAVEGNSRSFLKCLVVKELYGLSRANFLYGDIIRYLDTIDAKFDIIFCSGVLYHMKEPLKLLAGLKERTDSCYIWTGFYEADYMVKAYGEERFATQFGPGIPLEYGGFQCEGYPQYYGEALDVQAYAGGAAPHSIWLRKDDIINFLAHVGFDEVIVHDVDFSFAYAPRISITAQVRSSPRGRLLDAENAVDEGGTTSAAVVPMSTQEPDTKTDSPAGEDPRELFKRLVTQERATPVLEVGTLQAIAGRPTHHMFWFPSFARHDYLMADITPGADVDEIADLHALPPAWSGRFGAFLAVGVFEHLARPWIAAQEVFEVLRPGGLCYVATHQTFPLHGFPKDYFRFSDDALSVIFQDAGFELLSVGYEHRTKIIVPEAIMPSWASDSWNEAHPSYGQVYLVARRPATM